MKTVELKVMANGAEIRTGNLPDLHQCKGLKIAGNIKTVANWLSKKKLFDLINPAFAHVVVDAASGVIKLTYNEDLQNESVVTGKIEMNPDLAALELNQGKNTSPESLSEFLKMRRHFFKDRNEALMLISELKNLRIKVDKEVEKANDNRGGIRNLASQRIIENNIPEKFTLFLPVVNGFEPVEIEVEIYISPSNFDCSLVSPSLAEIIKNQKEALILEQVAEIVEAMPDLTFVFI